MKLTSPLPVFCKCKLVKAVGYVVSRHCASVSRKNKGRGAKDMSEAAQKSSRRAEKKAKTNETLFYAALTLFARETYDKVKVEAIAEAAGVSRRTFFRYFGSKEAVLFAPHRDILETISHLPAADDRLSGLAAWKALRLRLLGAGRAFAQRREDLQRVQEIVEKNEGLLNSQCALQLLLEEALEPGLRAVVPPSERQADVLALLNGAVSGALRRSYGEWITGRSQKSVIRLGASALDLLEPSIRALMEENGETGHGPQSGAGNLSVGGGTGQRYEARPGGGEKAASGLSRLPGGGLGAGPRLDPTSSKF